MTKQIPDITNPKTWTDQPQCDICKEKFGYHESWLIDTTGFMYHKECKSKKGEENGR